MVFIICTVETIQYQLLEAILEETIDQFFESYSGIIEDPLLLSGMTSSFSGFKMLIAEIFEQAQRKRVKWLRTECKICKEKKKICVKKSLITNAKSYPVSLVFEHEGHGLLLYIDNTRKIMASLASFEILIHQ